MSSAVYQNLLFDLYNMNPENLLTEPRVYEVSEMHDQLAQSVQEMINTQLYQPQTIQYRLQQIIGSLSQSTNVATYKAILRRFLADGGFQIPSEKTQNDNKISNVQQQPVQQQRQPPSKLETYLEGLKLFQESDQSQRRPDIQISQLLQGQTQQQKGYDMLFSDSQISQVKSPLAQQSAMNYNQNRYSNSPTRSDNKPASPLPHAHAQECAQATEQVSDMHGASKEQEVASSIQQNNLVVSPQQNTASSPVLKRAPPTINTLDDQPALIAPCCNLKPTQKSRTQRSSKIKNLTIVSSSNQKTENTQAVQNTIATGTSAHNSSLPQAESKAISMFMDKPAESLTVGAPQRTPTKVVPTNTQSQQDLRTEPEHQVSVKAQTVDDQQNVSAAEHLHDSAETNSASVSEKEKTFMHDLMLKVASLEQRVSAYESEMAQLKDQLQKESTDRQRLEELVEKLQTTLSTIQRQSHVELTTSEIAQQFQAHTNGPSVNFTEKNEISEATNDQPQSTTGAQSFTCSTDLQTKDLTSESRSQSRTHKKIKIKKIIKRKSQAGHPRNQSTTKTEISQAEQQKLDAQALDDVQRSVRQYLNQEDFLSILGDDSTQLYQTFEDKYLNTKSISPASVANFVSQLDPGEQKVNPKFIGAFCANVQQIAQTLQLQLDGENVRDIDIIKKVILLKDVKVLKQIAEITNIAESDRKEFIATICSWLVPTFNSWTSV